MNPKLKNKLAALAGRCDELAAEIRATLAESEESRTAGSARSKETEHFADVDSQIQELKALGRDQAQLKLAEVPQSGLAQLCRSLGGSSRDAKKPKHVVIDKILWDLFDFTKGHDILKQ